MVESSSNITPTNEIKLYFCPNVPIFRAFGVRINIWNCGCTHRSEIIEKFLRKNIVNNILHRELRRHFSECRAEENDKLDLHATYNTALNKKLFMLSQMCVHYCFVNLSYLNYLLRWYSEGRRKFVSPI